MGGLALIRRKGLFGITWGGPGAEGYGYAQAWSRGFSFGSPSAMDKPYEQHSTVSTALSIFVDDAAGVGWELYPEGRSKDDDKIESHPLLDLLDKPSPVMSGQQFLVGSYLSRRLFGAFAWYYPDLVLGRAGGLKATARSTGQILLLDPRRMSFRDGSWWLGVFDGDLKLDAEALTICARWSPYERGKWLSEIDAVLIDIEGDHAAAQYNRAFFRDQFGLPAGLMLPHKEETNGGQERMDFTKRFNEDAARHRRTVGALPPGWTWQDIGVKQKDMEFRNLREYARELILAAIGVPPFMAGVLDKANYANAREQREMYWMGPQTRFLAEVQAVLNSDFLPKLGVTGLALYPCWEKVKALLENLSEKVDVAAKLFTMGFTKRQINERLELGFDVDDLEDADVGYLPISVLPVSMVEEAHTPAGPTVASDQDEAKPNPNAKGLILHRNQATEGRRANVWRSISSRTRDIEARFEKSIRKHFRDIETEVLATMNGLKGWNLVQGIEKADESGLFDMPNAKHNLIRISVPLHKAALDRGGVSVLAELDAGNVFNVLDPNVAAKLAELTRKITRIDETVETALRESVIEGIKAGESVPQLAKRIQAVMDASSARAATIARTETGNAFTAGRVEGMRQVGISKQEWLTARDALVRDTHQAMDGEVRALDEVFSNGLRYPCDSSGDPSESINCRCTVIPVIGEAA